jgi:hypothetical protein
MRADIFSYRYAKEILQHPDHGDAWSEIEGFLAEAPIFIYPNKSKKNPRLDIVQQVMNTYFDRRLGVDLGWDYHPLATRIADSGLTADFRKDFGGLIVQAEVQFGNMARWYSDVFKFQTAYSQGLINLGLSIVPSRGLAVRIDSNIVNFERAVRELPSAELSITLPILLIGLAQDENTEVVDLRQTKFRKVSQITGKGKEENRWRVVNGYLDSRDLRGIGPRAPTGPMPSPGPNSMGVD